MLYSSNSMVESPKQTRDEGVRLKMTYDLSFIPSSIAQYLLDEIPIFRSPKTIQIFLLRQTHDYSIFRTEETRELNVAVLPESISSRKPSTKVAMLASKQKAPESRQFHTLVRGAASDTKRLDKDQQQCELKDNLCMRCPRCALFGAVSTEKGRGKGRWNIRHRIEYSTAYSLERWEEISEIVTFNAVSSVSQSTGQALGYTETVAPLANFPSVVTLTSTTKEEFCAYLKTLISCKSYGAETRTKGDMVNLIVGIAGGYEELMTPLEYNLALSERDYQADPIKNTYEIEEEFRRFAAFADKIAILKPKEVESLIDGVRKLEFSNEFINKMYTDAENFAKEVEKWAKEESGGG